MKGFEYVISDPVGIHARPAGVLAKKAKEFNSKITISANGKSAEVTKLMAVMALGIKCGTSVKVEAEGEDEAVAITAMEEFFRDNF